MKQSITKKIISAVLLFCLTLTYFIMPFSVKKTDAILGVGDISFTTITANIPDLIYRAAAKTVGVFLEKWKKRMITMLTNDMVNWIQNGTKPRFVTDFKGFVKKAADQAAGEAIGDAFLSNNIDICQPFRAQVNILVNRVRTIREPQVRCTLGDITEDVGNLKEQLFAFGEDFYKGNWSAWMRLHEGYNSVPGSYLATKDIVTAKAAQGTAAATAELTTGGGFLSSKKCAEYERQLFDIILPDGTVVKTGVSPEAGDVKFLTDQQAWLSGKLKEYNLSANGDYGIAPSGQTEKSGKLSSLMDMDDLPPASKCIEITNVTPGKVIGDQISHLLQKTGIDNLTESNTLNQILNALIDAAVNRVAREGLSMVKVGKGSWTSPPKGGTGSNRQVQQDTFGMVSPAAIDLLTKAVNARTEAQQLQDTLNKLIANDKNLDIFKNRLIQIRANLNVGFTCGKIDGAGPTIDGCMFGGSFTDRKGDRQSWGKLDFNQESNNPGPYLANKALNEIIGQTLADLETTINNAKKTIPETGDCNIVNLTFTMIPDDPNYLPFVDPEHDTDYAIESMMTWHAKKESYITQLLTANLDQSYIPASNWLKRLDGLQSQVQAWEIQYKQAADNYNTLINNIAITNNDINEKIAYLDKLQAMLVDYASILADYDTAGRTTNLLNNLKDYGGALSGKYETTWGHAREILIPLGYKIPEDLRNEDLATDDIALDTATEQLKESQKRTRDEWVAIQQKIIDRGGADAARASIKKGIIQATSSFIDASLEPILLNTETTTGASSENTANSSTQIGMSPSDAVAKAVNDYHHTKGISEGKSEKDLINFDVDLISSDLDDMEARISKQLNGTGDLLGKFETTRDKRVKLGIEGGNSEWSQYFRNRFIFAYVNMLNNLYNLYIVQDYAPSGKQGNCKK